MESTLGVPPRLCSFPFFSSVTAFWIDSGRHSLVRVRFSCSPRTDRTIPEALRASEGYRFFALDVVRVSARPFSMGPRVGSRGGRGVLPLVEVGPHLRRPRATSGLIPPDVGGVSAVFCWRWPLDPTISRDVDRRWADIYEFRQ